MGVDQSDAIRCRGCGKIKSGLAISQTRAREDARKKMNEIAQIESNNPATPRRLDRAFFARSVHLVAPDLIGTLLLVDGAGGIVTEVEAYDPEDPASHGYGGRTARNAAMFGPPGHAYVYRSYGIHWCLNFVCEDEGTASAVLIRALAPIRGQARMRRQRGLTEERLLCSGPGRLCQALGITGAHDRLPLDAPPFALHARSEVPEIVVGPRIGITKAADLPWRYGLAGSPFLSRRFL
jgi:DNA-3-methyladenine glycosylase